MVPAWIVNTLIIILGCVLAVYLGSALPEYDLLGGYMVGFLIVCTFCLVTNNFPMMLALALWYPFPPPVPAFRAFPAIALVLAWFGCFLILKLCMEKKLTYIRSFNWLMVITFLWVPVRFAMNPVTKLGTQVVGGSGISGAYTYFLYALSGIITVALGFILTSRERIYAFMRWSFYFALFDGLLFLFCAFTPAVRPTISWLGMPAAGGLADGVVRYLPLPGYGLFLVQASLCPALFRVDTSHWPNTLSLWRIVMRMLFSVYNRMPLLFYPLGVVMILVGGNRSAMAAALLVTPISFFLRRKLMACIASLIVFALGVGALNILVQNADAAHISGFVRSLGMLNSKIDDATGGSASAKWRYEVWQSGIEKIKESPLVGKGFGHLDQNIDVAAETKAGSSDFDVVLASGLAHNGFISAAYGFGVPFMLGLTVALFIRMISHGISAWKADQSDLETRDFHAFLSAGFVAAFVAIYSAIDMCAVTFWVYASMGIIFDKLSRKAKEIDRSEIMTEAGPFRPASQGRIPGLARN